MKHSESYLIFGGTGSLGTTLVGRLLAQKKTVYVFSRDEAKHHTLQLSFPAVHSLIGDIRDYDAVFRAIATTTPRYIINAAAMKQIPLCEEFPYEALRTNTIGTQNVVHAVREHLRTHTTPLTIVSVSTDKACEPVNAYGMTKALQERIHLQANDPKRAIFTAVRYGNVLNSNGSVIPVFQERIKRGQPLPITDGSMTRFLLALDEAVDLIFAAVADTEGGTIFVPKVKAATVSDLAQCLIDASSRPIKQKIIGIRPGEKMHEVLISEEELRRTEELKNLFVIHSEISGKKFAHLSEAYRSNQSLLTKKELAAFLKARGAL